MHSIADGLVDGVEAAAGLVADECPSAAASTIPRTLIAYVGDHLHGDVLGSHERGWLPIGIVEEMESSNCPATDYPPVAAAVDCGAVPTPCPSTPVKALWGDFFTCDDGVRLTYCAHLMKRSHCTALSDAAMLQQLFPLNIHDDCVL